MVCVKMVNLRAWSWAISSKKQEKHYTSLLKMGFILTAEKKKPYSLKLATNALLLWLL